MDETYIAPVTDLYDEDGEPVYPETETECVKPPRFGKVYNCVKLNIREAPTKDSDIISVVPAGTTLEIYEDDLMDHEWYRVCTAFGVEGYCMKYFIKE